MQNNMYNNFYHEILSHKHEEDAIFIQVSC